MITRYTTAFGKMRVAGDRDVVGGVSSMMLLVLLCWCYEQMPTKMSSHHHHHAETERIKASTPSRVRVLHQSRFIIFLCRYGLNSQALTRREVLQPEAVLL